MESVDNPLLTTFSTRLGRTTLARGILTGSLLGCTVLRGILIGRLVIVSPLLTEVLSLKTYKSKRESNVLNCMLLLKRLFKLMVTCSFIFVTHTLFFFLFFLKNYMIKGDDYIAKTGHAWSSFVTNTSLLGQQYPTAQEYVN